jgi:hypothetical protein
VTLAISATDNVGVTGYYASESSTTPEGSASWTSVTSTTSYSANVSFTLSSDDNEIKTVYIWFKDSAGNISSPASDTIMAVYYSWKLIAKQADSDVQLFSSNARSTFLENADDSDNSTFMSIGNLNESNYDDTDGKYKFRLVWGGMEVDNMTIKEVVWTQTSWLTDSTIHSDIGFQEIGSDIGFQEIGTSGLYTSGYYTQRIEDGFWGLGKSESNKCVIDGNGSTTNWWHCVGVITKYQNDSIPGPRGKKASSMYLYIWSPSNL